MSNDFSGLVVQLLQSGRQFHTISNISILESGLSAGISLPYGCANGSCGDCKARVVAGTVGKLRFHDYPLTEVEKLNGVCLLCSYAAESDLVLDVTEATSIEDIPFQNMRGKLCHLEKLPDMLITRFKLTRGNALRYLPGQYAMLTYPDKQQYKLPIANCPCESSYLEFHLPRKEESTVSLLKPLDRVSIEGPCGNFTFSEPSVQQTDSKEQQKPVLFIAINSGYSAIKPLIEHVLSLEEIPCALIWIAEKTFSHYHHNLCRSWTDAFDHFTYLPLDSIDEIPNEVAQIWSKQCSNSTLKDTEVYISGDSDSYSQCTSILTQSGIKAESIHLDAGATEG